MTNSDGESETYRHLLLVPFIATCNLHMNIDNNNDNVKKNNNNNNNNNDDKKSKLNGGNIIKAINSWAVPVVRYTARIIDWIQAELENLD